METKEAYFNANIKYAQLKFVEIIENFVNNNLLQFFKKEFIPDTTLYKPACDLSKQIMNEIGQLTQDRKTIKLMKALIVHEVVTFKLKEIQKLIQSDIFEKMIGDMLNLDEKSELLENIEKSKQTSQKLREQFSTYLDNFTDEVQVQQIQGYLEKGDINKIEKEIEDTKEYLMTANKEFGIFLYDNSLIVGTADRNARILNASTFEVQQTLQLGGQGFVTASVNQHYLTIAVAIQPIIRIFDKTNFNPVQIVHIGRSALHFCQISQDQLFISSLQQLMIVDTTQNQIGNILSSTAFTKRFLIADKTSNPNEMVLACEQGLHFCSIDPDNYSVQLSEEQYFAGKVVQGIKEFKKDLFFVAVFRSAEFYILDRAQKMVIRQIKSPSSNTLQFNFRSVNIRSNTEQSSSYFVTAGIIRNQTDVMFIDFKTFSIISLFKSKYQQDNWVYLQTEAEVNDKERLICYCLEEEATSSIKRYQFSKEFSSALSVYMNSSNTNSIQHVSSKYGSIQQIKIDPKSYLDFRKSLKAKIQTMMQLQIEVNKQNEEWIALISTNFKKLFSIDVNSENNMITQEHITKLLGQSMMNLKKQFIKFEKALDSFTPKLRKISRLSLQRDSLDRISTALLSIGQDAEVNLTSQVQTFEVSNQMEFSVFFTKDHVLMPNKENNITVLRKKDFSPVGDLNLNQKQMITVVQNNDFIFVGTNRGGEMPVFDISTLSLVSTISLTRCPLHVLKLNSTHFLCCELTNLEIVNMTTMNVDCQRFFDGFRFLYASCCKSKSEILLGTAQGLRIVKINMKQPVIVMTKESYIENMIVQGVIEYRNNLLCAAAFLQNKLIIIDRKVKQVIKLIHNPSMNQKQFNLIKFPGLSFPYPYLLLRDQQVFMAVDLINYRMIPFLKTAYNSDNWSYHQLCAEIDEEQQIKLYSCETAANFKGKQITLHRDFLKLLKVLQSK